MKRAYAIEINGVTRKLAEWAQLYGIPYPTITGRYQRGDRGERLIRKIDEKRSRRGRW